MVWQQNPSDGEKKVMGEVMRDTRWGIWTVVNGKGKGDEKSNGIGVIIQNRGGVVKGDKN